ncbi:ArsR/SmtB family transcription factor [Microlunatus flavus]|uniref:Helix-turn-helix domain-containing protein n=1 Tax=Microlunatus flavus TaxID=1036181 RepID=A0A1H9AEW0_9ACTN|nr:helix-turn-helix domain-containing protein [Microlunatus flavus]SEP75274.1 Helix-turn-helix domain-containing protein [Microlunatus flavus]
MADLEARVAALEEALARLTAAPPSGSEESPLPDLWLVEGLRERHPTGAVAFGGTVAVGKGDVTWQWGADAESLRGSDWSSAAGVLDALAHPVRLRLLQRVLNGTTTTADLALDDGLGTTGQLHHHLRALVAAGWLQSVARGTWAVPAPRVVPLLVVVSAGLAR